MRCHICDVELSEKEIIFNKQLDAFEPCTTCLDISFEAAYSNGFDIEDNEFVVLDPDFDDTGNDRFLSSFRTEGTFYG